MATLLVLVVLALTVAAAIGIPLLGPVVSSRSYILVSWVPAAALGLEWIFADTLMRVLSYGVILVPLATCLLSVLLGVVGVMLLIRGPARGVVLAGATLLASLPALLLFGWIASGFALS